MERPPKNTQRGSHAREQAGITSEGLTELVEIILGSEYLVRRLK